MTASVRRSIFMSALSTLPNGGIPATVLTGTSPPATMAATSPSPPPPLTSAAWAAANASARDCPVMSAMHIAVAVAPAALMPNPWLTGRSFLMPISNPDPGARICATILVMWAVSTTPSMRMLTTESSRGVTVAVAPLLSLMPIPRDPVLMASNEFTGWKTHETCPGQKADVIASSHSSPESHRRPRPSSRRCPPRRPW